jgi:hypothetical protein
MNRPPEFAEQYSAAERIRFLVGGAVAGALLIGVAKLWFFPWLSEFSASAQCRTVFGRNGAAVLLYGLFAGLPFSAGLVVACTAGRRGFKVLADKRFPPIGEKSFGLTRIRRGPSARLIGYLHVVALAPFIALGIWGCTQAAVLSKQARHKSIDCPDGDSMKPKPIPGSDRSRR